MIAIRRFNIYRELIHPVYIQKVKLYNKNTTSVFVDAVVVVIAVVVVVVAVACFNRIEYRCERVNT